MKDTSWRDIALFFLVCVVAGNYYDNRTPAGYFKRHRTADYSPDYGVKAGDDHVITVHGFVENESVCADVAKMLNHCKESADICLVKYSCDALN